MRNFRRLVLGVVSLLATGISGCAIEAGFAAEREAKFHYEQNQKRADFLSSQRSPAVAKKWWDECILLGNSETSRELRQCLLMKWYDDIGAKDRATDLMIQTRQETFFREAKQHFHPDKNLVTSAWATCVAAARLTSDFLELTSPMQSKEYDQQANGAVVALTMSFVSDNIRRDSGNLKQAFETATTLSQSMPQAQMVSMMAAMERNPDNGMSRLLETQRICNTNEVLQYQQDLIDVSRKFRASLAN